LLHPLRHLRFVEIVFVDVDPAPILALASGRDGPERRAEKEGDFDVVGEGVEAEEPALPLDAVEG
jgi:hypothetical protein